MNTASPDPAAIALELEALGEAPLSAEELATVRTGQLDDEPEIASLARLSELSEPLEFDALSELETHRAWRRVEQELEQDSSPAATPASAPLASPAPRRWLFAVAGLAAAAALALLVVPRGSGDGLSAEEVAQQGESVRRALSALDDGRSDSDRARDRARAYQQRLEERGG